MQEMERKRIATELHDSIGQSLTALSFSVSNALSASERGDRRATRELLEKLVPQVKETIAEVRRIAMDLRPTTLDDLGIIGTLSWFFREFRVVHADVLLHTDIRLQENEVVPALRTTLFRVVQEAVNNFPGASSGFSLNQARGPMSPPSGRAGLCKR
jgi:signal transduction histidine kinase